MIAWCMMDWRLMHRGSRQSDGWWVSKATQKAINNAVNNTRVNDPTRTVRPPINIFSFYLVLGKARSWFHFAFSEKNWTSSNYTSACWALSGIVLVALCSGNKKRAPLAVLLPATCVLSRLMLRLLACHDSCTLHANDSCGTAQQITFSIRTPK